jgi:glycosyltransferase involved in cell wall biosynthesis
MKIAFVSSHINKSLQWLWYSRGLQKTGQFTSIIHVIIYDKGSKAPVLAEDLRKEGFTVYTIATGNIFSKAAAIFECRKIFKKHQIEIVHTTLPYGNLIGLNAALLAGIDKRVTTCENASWAHDYKSKKQELIDKLTFRLAKKIIAVADSAHEYISDNWNIDKKKLVTIYHGLEEKEYSNIAKERVEAVKAETGISGNDFIVGMISRLELWKGHEYAIKAMKEVTAKYPSVKLYIFGSGGKDKERILSMIREMQLEDSIFYKGFINDPIALFQLFDIHLHIPINKYVENCGISIIEGMISERPQILTLSGYSFQSAKHLKNSYVVDYCNAAEVSQAIIKLFEDSDLRTRLAAAAKQTALDEYSNNVKVKKHLELYSSL